jgi:hypothetical protein
MQCPDVHSFLDDLLVKWKDVIGADYDGYRNHCHRMVAFCLALRTSTEEEQRKIVIAACFHDIGLWTARTFDYIPPSLPPAKEYLQREGLAHWAEEICAMIGEHHKLRTYRGLESPLVEAFRRADLVDFSLGLFTFGLTRTFIREVKAQYPNAGFHRALVRMASAWFVRHPLNPAPMMKW